MLFAILLCVSYRARWHIEQISGFQIVIRTRSNPTTNCNRHVHSINLGLTHIRFCIGYKLTQTYSQRRKLDHICKYFYINQLEIYTPKHIPLTYSPDASPFKHGNKHGNKRHYFLRGTARLPCVSSAIFQPITRLSYLDCSGRMERGKGREAPNVSPIPSRSHTGDDFGRRWTS